jgi:serine/threonine-protein kinase
MKPESDPHFEAILLKASSLAGDERRSFLDRSCANYPEFRAELEQRLEFAPGDLSGQYSNVPAGPDNARNYREENGLHVESAGAEDDVGRDSEYEKAGPGDQDGWILDGKYRIDAEIGRGAMGRIYRATQLSLDRTVAIKVMPNPGSVGEKAAERFRREALALARLSHPNIATVHDTGIAPGHGPYIVMEYLTGCDLRAEIRRTGPVDADAAIRVFAPLCEAVDAAHLAGIIHRDLKPANIFIELTKDGDRLKVLDFGLAKLVENDGAQLAQLSDDDVRLGTILYMAPEQWEGRPVTGRTDVYALGCIFFEMVTGRPPFYGDTMAEVCWGHTCEDPPRPSAVREGLNPAVDGPVLRALRKDPDSRFESAGDFLAALVTSRDMRAASGSVGPMEPAMLLFHDLSRRFSRRLLWLLRPKTLVCVILWEILLNFAVVGGVTSLRDRIRAVNRGTLASIRALSGTEPERPVVDLALASVSDSARSRGFRYSAEESSRVVTALKGRSVGASDLLGAAEYSSLFNLLRELQLRGRYEDEFELLRVWALELEAPSRFAQSDYRYYLDYLETSYSDHVATCLAGFQIGRARWFAHMAARRIRLVDAPPLYLLDNWARGRISRILLVEAFVDSVDLDFTHTESVRQLVSLAENDFQASDEKKLATVSHDPAIEPLLAYCRGVYAFRSARFDDAAIEFRKASVAPGSERLRQLALLMIGRCEYWKVSATNPAASTNGSLSPPEAPARSTVLMASRVIEKLASQVTEPSYRTDLEAYVTRLREVSNVPE